MPREALIAGRYRIQRRLGSGSLGTVYLARDAAADRLVALKVIRAERLGAEGLARLKEEFRAIAGLHHTQVAVAHDFGYTAEGGLPFYTREYVEGSPLAPGPPGIEQPVPPAEFLRPFFDLLEALDYLHAHEILHLDIHAGNLIVAGDPGRGSVLIDFGLWGPLRDVGSSSLVMVRSSMPPELLRKEGVGPASDLYSVGRLLLYRLTGNPESVPRLLRDIPGWGPRLTLELERIAAKALEADTRRRFQSAGEFREALSRALGGSARSRSRPEPGDLTLGRACEIGAIEDVLRGAASGRTAALWFQGRAGMGKS
ncbi:MAG: serine/threonine-protein kinase, partial [Candidatus Methylomirabilales bacterium]